MVAGGRQGSVKRDPVWEMPIPGAAPSPAPFLINTLPGSCESRANHMTDALERATEFRDLLQADDDGGPYVWSEIFDDRGRGARLQSKRKFTLLWAGVIGSALDPTIAAADTAAFALIVLLVIHVADALATASRGIHPAGE